MAKYQVTFELTTRRAVRSKRIPRHKLRDSQRHVPGVLKGDNNHVIGTEHHRSVELRSDVEPSQWQPIGT